ncbi:hypothetical protein HGRIS_000898 [Hohenbuehelia grisea]|uniref:Polysaccharide lyase 14 domain-containing protein n=1 Tax=Hohenbuehelia grisea TaxID=104357 RepID=A0ABR3IQ22_9AGAR
MLATKALIFLLLSASAAVEGKQSRRRKGHRKIASAHHRHAPPTRLATPNRFATSIKTNMLFPVAAGNSWTTSSEVEDALPLSDSTLRLVNGHGSLWYTTAPDGKEGIQVRYPRRSRQGIHIYARGPSWVDLTTAKEVTFGYSIFFEEGFEWNKGGKLPGLYGGDSDRGARGCSGGRRSDSCFSTRLMWRPSGAGEFYTYLPQVWENKKQCRVQPKSHCNPRYGASVGRGSFYFEGGRWNTVTERIRLNDVGEANGEMELFVDGESVISVYGLVLRTSHAGRFRGIQLETFFGGSDSSWGPPRDVDAWFSDFSVAIVETL